jgi:flagellar M-ring protein FliF
MAEEVGTPEVGGEGLPGGIPGDRRFLLIAAVALVVVLIAVFFVMRSCGVVAKGPQYTVIYSHLELKDAADVIARLKELRIPYEIREEGSSVAVPGDRADEARLGLAEESLPRGGSVGWEIFDETKLGATDFDRRIQFIRAISGELARTIRHIDVIDDARVQIVIPETRLFEVARAPVTASVLLRLEPGERLTGNQVNGIVHLVASSVENLKPEDVIVVDIYGNILTPSTTPVLSPVSLPREVIEARESEIEKLEAEKRDELAKVKAKEAELKMIEEELKKKEEALKKKELTAKKPSKEQVISEEELRKKVEAEERREGPLTVEEKALLRLKMKKEIDDQLSSKAQLLLNKFYPPNTAVVKVNVELGTPKIEYVPETVKVGTQKKEVRLKAKEIVTLRKLTAVVLVDKRLDLTQKLKKDTYAAVAGAIGYDRSRGDTITLRRVPFRLAEAPPGKTPSKKKGVSLPFKLTVDFSNIISALRRLVDKARAYPIVDKAVSFILGQKNLGKILGGIFGFLFIIFILRRIFRRRGAEEEYEISDETEAGSSADRGGVASSLNEARSMAESNPESIANLLKSWLSEEAA